MLDLGGLKLTARCTGDGTLRVTATTASTAYVRAATTDAPADTAYGEDDDFRAGQSFDVLPGANDDVDRHAVYHAADGGVVSASTWPKADSPPARGPACLFAGTATYAPAG